MTRKGYVVCMFHGIFADSIQPNSCGKTGKPIWCRSEGPDCCPSKAIRIVRFFESRHVRSPTKNSKAILQPKKAPGRVKIRQDLEYSHSQ